MPRRLGPSLAGSTHNPADSWRSSRAATGATSARRRALKVSAKKTAAKATGAIGCGIPFVVRKQHTGAGVVPRNFRNVRYRGSESGRVSRAPVRAVCIGVRVAVIRATHSHVVRSRCESVDADSMRCLRCTVVASSRPTVTCSNKNRNALCHCLLIGGIVSGIGRCPVHGLALAVADTYDGRRSGVGVDEVLDRNQTAECGTGISAGCKLDRSTWSHGAGIFCIQDCLRVIGSKHTWIAAIVGPACRSRVNLCERTGWVVRKTESRTERRPVRGAIHVRIFNHHDCLTLARKT